MTIKDMWNKLLDLGVSEQTLQVVTDVAGFSEETMESVLYSVTGYRYFDQL